MPKKPDRPFASIVFSADGKVSSNVEHTDLSITELELLIAKKFTTTLIKREIYNFSDVCISPEEPADVTAKKSDDSPLLIQITEVVDEDTRVLFETRSRLLTALRNHENIASQFQGCLVDVVTSHDEPRLPIDIEDLISQIVEVGKNIKTLSIGKKRALNLDSPPENLQIGLIIQRLSEPVQAKFNVTGSAATTSTNWLLQSIQKKVEKKYAAPKDEFWLLAYGGDMPLQENDSHIHETATYLDSINHSFDEVWYFFPRPNRDGGSVIRIWKRNGPNNRLKHDAQKARAS